MSNHNVNEEDDDFLTLSLSTVYRPPPPIPPPLISQPRNPRPRRSPNLNLKAGKSVNIDAPYPWATTRRAQIHSMQYLKRSGIDKISGRVQCKKCNKDFEIEYDLRREFAKISSFIERNKESMRHRAPELWRNPKLPDCEFCKEEGCLKPVSAKKRSINWLFLLLGQMVGCCRLEELKYFCKHTRNHRTGAKDRVLYLTYLGLCKQLQPQGLFDP